MIESIALTMAGFIVICIIVRTIYFQSKLMAVTRHLNAFLGILEATSERKSDMQAYAQAHANLAERWPEITALFAQARLRVLFGRKVGFGGFQPTGSISVWESLSEDGVEQKKLILEALHQARGYFRSRRNESFSRPIYWIESFINWPKSLLGYLGIDREGAIAKFLQIVVLILEIAVAFIAAINSISL